MFAVEEILFRKFSNKSKDVNVKDVAVFAKTVSKHGVGRDDGSNSTSSSEA